MARVATDELTENQRMVWHAIADHIRAEKIPPSHKELLAAVGNPSESGINRHLASLRDLGYLEWTPRSPRSLRLHKWPDGKRARL